MASPTNSEGKRKKPMTVEQWRRVGARLIAASKELHAAREEIQEHYPLPVQNRIIAAMKQLSRSRHHLSNVAYRDHGGPGMDAFDGDGFICG